MRLLHFVTAIGLCLGLGACSLLGEAEDDEALRQRYAHQTIDKDADQLYRHTLLINLGVGAASQAVPAFHLLGLVVDAGVLVYSFDGLIYGTGAIAAREGECQALVAREDYWQVLSTWFKGIRDSDEFNTAMGLATVLTPSTPGASTGTSSTGCAMPRRRSTGPKRRRCAAQRPLARCQPPAEAAAGFNQGPCGPGWRVAPGRCRQPRPG